MIQEELEKEMKWLQQKYFMNAKKLYSRRLTKNGMVWNDWKDILKPTT